MMLVRNYIDKSQIHGVGVFAGEFIPEGTCIWELTPGCDQIYSDAMLAALLPVQREIILFYGYIEPGMEGAGFTIQVRHRVERRTSRLVF
jgi:hypothetical protein